MDIVADKWQCVFELFAGYVRSFAQLAWKSMAGSVAIVPAPNNGINQYPNPLNLGSIGKRNQCTVLYVTLHHKTTKKSPEMDF